VADVFSPGLVDSRTGRGPILGVNVHSRNSSASSSLRFACVLARVCFCFYTKSSYSETRLLVYTFPHISRDVSEIVGLNVHSGSTGSGLGRILARCFNGVS
jgi:hypothetical protein